MGRTPSLLLLPLILLFPRAAPAQDHLVYSGTASISLSILYAGALKAFEERTGLRFDRIDAETGTGRGLDDLVTGKATIAGSGRELTPEEKTRGILGHLIAWEAIGIWVNQANPVKALTRDQLKGIFSGRIRNWKEVGGKDQSIAVIIEPESCKRITRDLIQKVAMAGLPFRSDCLAVVQPRDQIIEVSLREDALCAASNGFLPTLSRTILSRVRTLEVDGVSPDRENIANRRYLFIRPLFLATLGEPYGKVKSFIDFLLSPEGQAIVAKSFIPARKPV